MTRSNEVLAILLCIISVLEHLLIGMRPFIVLFPFPSVTGRNNSSYIMSLGC